MKLQIKKTQNHGFTLIEMIGVLAVIAILAALLIPKIMNVISDSRVSSAISGINTMKAATMEYFGKYGKWGGTNGIDFVASDPVKTNWDTSVLFNDKIVERPLKPSLKMGCTQADVVIADGAATGDTAFDLANSGAIDTTTAVNVVYAKFTAVAKEDAEAIDLRVDGTPTFSGGATRETAGRVKYAIDTAPTYTVLVYLAHK